MRKRTFFNLGQLWPFEGRFAAVSTALDGFHVGSFEGPKKASTLLAAAQLSKWRRSRKMFFVAGKSTQMYRKLPHGPSILPVASTL